MGATPAQAQAAEKRNFDIPSQSLPSALTIFGRQSGLQISVPAAIASGRTSAAVKGSMSPVEALSRLLTGTGLAYRISGNIVTLERAPQASGDGAIQLGPVRVEGNGGATGIRLARTPSDPNATEGTGLYTGSQTTTATRLPLTVKETPQSVTIVTRDRIDDFQLLTVDSVLTSVVGINELRTETNRGNFISRGFIISNFQVDGVDANYLGSVSGGRTPSVQFDSYLYDRIEVVRGATGLLSPTGDPSATINLVRKKPGKEFAAAGTVAVGNREFLRGGVDLSVPITADGGVRARLLGLYQQSDSWRDRASDDRFLLSAMLEFDVTPTTLVRLASSYEKRDSRGPSYGSLPVYDTQGNPIDLPRSTNLATTWSRWDQSQMRTDLTVEQQLGDDWKLTGVIGRSIANSNPMMAFLGGGTPDPNGDGRSFYSYVSDQERSQWTYDVNLQGSFTLFGREHMLSLGVNGYRQKDDRNSPNYASTTVPFLDLLASTADTNIYTFTGIAPQLPPSTEYNTNSTKEIDMDGLFGSLRLSLADPLHVILGGRITDWRTSDAYSEPGSQSLDEYEPGSVFTPFAGVTFDVTPQLTLYASYADVFTPQTERTVDDDFIAPIVGSNMEIGFKLAILDDLLTVNGAIYQARLDNVAELVLPEVILPDGSNAYTSSGKGNKTRGFEIELSGAITDRWNIYTGFSLNRTKTPEGDLTFTERPRETFKLQTMWRPPVLDDRLAVGGGVTWQGETFNNCDYCVADRVIRIEQEAYALVSLAANYDITDRISLGLNANNLFDKTYYTYAGFGYYGEPRTVILTANARF